MSGDDHGARVHAAASDPDAMEWLYREHADAVWRFAIRRCRDAHEAADLVAATFLAALGSAPAFDPRRGSVRAWLLGIAAHRLADARRREARERAAAARIDGASLLTEDERAAIDERIDAARRADALRDALAALPSGQREVLDLVAVAGLTPREAATVLGIQPIAARVRLARARRRLAEAERLALRTGPRDPARARA